MKVSLYVPKGTPNVKTFIRDEIAQASNVKSKETRKDIESGLRKILNKCPEIFDEGISYHTDGDELLMNHYNGLR